MSKSTTYSLAGVAFAAGAIFLAGVAGCTNTKYPDLMRVTAECEVVIENQEQIYRGSGPMPARISARDRIINLREKQMIMAQRINVKTMPEVANNTMTYQQGEARKAELVQAATARYNAALALPVPSADTDAPTPK